MKRTAGWSGSVFFLFLPILLRKLHGDGCCCTEPSEKFRVRPRYDYEKKHASRDSKMCCCCRFCCGAPTTDERIHAPVLHDASQIDYCRYWSRASIPPITSITRGNGFLVKPCRRFSSQKPYYKWNTPYRISTSNERVSCEFFRVNGWNSTLQAAWKKLQNVSCECGAVNEYDRLNGWNSTLNVAWYARHVRWTCIFYT